MLALGCVDGDLGVEGKLVEKMLSEGLALGVEWLIVISLFLC